MVNDCSSDKSGDIIEEYAKKYDNFFVVNLAQNSGVAGKPRNVGIEKASGDYIMFLDPDDYYAADACENLYNKITEEKVDIVFGKYLMRYDDGDVRKPIVPLYSINEPEKRMDMDNLGQFVSTPPSVWTKIFKREFIENYNLKFPEGIPGEDLVFVTEAFLKANSVIFINKVITSYSIRKNENSSVSFNINKNYITGLIQANNYTYNICNECGKEEYFQFVKGNVIYWLNQFSLSDLSNSEKKEVLKSSSFIFKKYSEFTSDPPETLKPLIDLIINEKYEDAIILADKLTDHNKNQEKTLNPSKLGKKLFIICDMLHVELGGLGRVVLDRSKLLEENGFDVSIITINADNYDFIESQLRKHGYLHSNINLINIYDYYEFKNSRDLSLSYLNKIDKKSWITENDYQMIDEYKKKKLVRYFQDGLYKMAKKWKPNGFLDHIAYFNEKGINIKSDKYINGFLKYELSYYDNKKINKRRHFTKDGFCYLTEMYNSSGHKYEIYLFDRTSNEALSFKTDVDFQKHFFTELCNECEEKPYLICDGSGPTPLISNIESDIAYKISQLHSNPYTQSYRFGGPIRKIGILEKIENNDIFITLTEKQRKDIMKEFGDYGNTCVIPNFVQKNELLNVDINPNKISYFGRISPEKNIGDAVKAFEIVAKKRKNARLEIFGRATLPAERNELKKIKKMIKTCKLENNVFIMGHSSNVYAEMEESVATILTSHFEGFGMVIIESMLNSTPVISYDIDYGPKEVIDHGVNGFLVKEHNTKQMAKYIIELLDNTEKAKKMGIAGRKTVLEHYTEEVVISKWKEMLKNLPKEKSSDINIETRIQQYIENVSTENVKITNKLFTKFPSLYILLKIKETGLKNAMLTLKGYKIVKENHFLDVVYYLNRNNKVRLSGFDPTLHYLYHGYREGKNPNPTFDGDFYMKKYKDVKKTNLNPLVHYGLYGLKEGRITINEKKEKNLDN